MPAQIGQVAMSPAHLDEDGHQADRHIICSQLRHPTEAGQHCQAQGGAGNLLALLLLIGNDHALQATKEFMAQQLSCLAGQQSCCPKECTQAVQSLCWQQLQHG